MNKKKILGIVISVGNVSIKDIITYTGLSEQEILKHVDKLIKENKIKYSQMYFRGFLNASQLDIDVAKANGSCLDWYSSIDDLIDCNGEGADIIEILIPDFEIELDDGYIMTFEDIGEN